MTVCRLNLTERYSPPIVQSTLPQRLGTLFKYAKRDPCLVAYGGVVLQRFVFTKFCMGENAFEFIA